MSDAQAPTDDVAARLEYLRGELRAERISYGELAELADFASRGAIDGGDVELLEAAGVPEHPEPTVAERLTADAAHAAHVASERFPTDYDAAARYAAALISGGEN